VAGSWHCIRELHSIAFPHQLLLPNLASSFARSQPEFSSHSCISALNNTGLILDRQQ
jgi:hypothetical protein